MSPSLEIGCASSGLAEASRVTGQEGCRRLNPLETPGWDELVLTLPGASFFHSASWAAVLHDTYGHRPHYFCAMNGERLVATLPVVGIVANLLFDALQDAEKARSASPIAFVFQEHF